MSTAIAHINQIKRLENARIYYPAFQRAMDKLTRAHQLSLEGAAPRNLLLLGPSGAGKSTALETYRRQHPSEELVENRRIPVLYVRVPAAPTMRSFAEEILIAIGEPMYSSGTTTEKTARIVRLLKACQVEMVMIDEFHHFLDRGKRASATDVSEWMKVLIDTLRIPVVLAGLPQSEELLRINEQLRRRFAAHCLLAPLELEQGDGQSEFADVVFSLDPLTGENGTSGLATSELLPRLHYATNGLIGYLSRLLVTATEIRLAGNYRQIEPWMLEQAFTEAIWSGGTGKLNPFNPAFVFRRLNKRGEPFEPTVFNSPRHRPKPTSQ